LLSFVDLLGILIETADFFYQGSRHIAKKPESESSRKQRVSQQANQVNWRQVQPEIDFEA
jgi:hypothetical protein